MSEKLITISASIGNNLRGLEIRELVEVYTIDDDGKKSQSYGCLQDEDAAKAFAQNQTDAAYFKTKKRIVLTNGEVGFLIGDPVTLLNDEEVAQNTKAKILAKLTDEEKRVLNLKI